MKKVVTIFFLMFTVLSFSQKVKIKDDIVSIDEVETYKIEKEGKSRTVSTMTGEEFITLLKDGFEFYKAGNRHYTRVFIIRFLISGDEVYTDMSEKDILKVIYKSGMVSADGKIDEDKKNIFVNKYNDENLKIKLAK